MLSYGGKIVRAHRLAFQLGTGIDPQDKHVLHKCDTPSCVSPDHLYLGTNEDNIVDKVRKGRSLSGSKNPSAKLSTRQVSSIRQDRRTNMAIAKEYGVSKNTIRNIKSGKSWSC